MNNSQSEAIISDQLRAECNAGPAQCQVYILGAPKFMDVNPGDRVIMTEQVDRSPLNPSKYLLRATIEDVHDGAAGMLFYQSQSDPQIPASAFVGMTTLTGESGFDFGVATWAKVTIDGAPLGSVSPEGLNMIRNPNHPKLLIATSPLLAGGASSETTGWATDPQDRR
jgi:hypothetical protein